jgi:hypothetical protein
VSVFGRSFGFFFGNSPNKFLILNCHRHRYELAYVSRRLGRGGGAVNGTWLEAHASVTLEILFNSIDMEKLFKMVGILLVDADVLIIGIVVVSSPTVAALELDVGPTSGDLHQATIGSGRWSMIDTETAGA